MNKFYIHVPELKDKLAVLAKFQMIGVEWSGGNKPLDKVFMNDDCLSYDNHLFRDTIEYCKANDFNQILIDDFLKCETIEQACELVEPVKETWYKHVYWSSVYSHFSKETVMSKQKWKEYTHNEENIPIKVNEIVEWGE